jgi:hypothetical protein
MTFRQVYYTSCTRGLRQTRGFQIHAATPGIDPKHCEAVERLSLYTPPPSFPTRPTAEDLRDFPVVLLHEDLGGGMHVLAQTRYVGTDYSGRYGNYFTHSLLSDAEAFEQEPALPVELWGSPAWVSTEQEDTHLPPMMALRPGTAVTRDRVARFLQAPHRARRLPAFLACVEQALETRRRILIVDHEDGEPGGYAAALWIAAASYALPRRLALKLTFDTYVRNPYQSSALLCGLLGGRDTDFAFASHEVQQQFYVFDFVADVFTANVPEPSSGMRSVVDELQAGTGGSLAGLLAWLDRVAPETPPKDYPQARLVYAPAAEGDTRAALRWAIPLAKTLDPPRVVKLFDAATQQELPPAEDMVRLREAVAGRSDLSGVESSFVEWFFRHLLPRGSVDLATRAWSRPAAGHLCKAFWENPLEALATADDPRRLALMLRVAEDTGVLDGAWEQVGKSVVAPRLIETRYDLGAYDELDHSTLDGIATGLLGARQWSLNALPRGRFGTPNALLHALARAARRGGEDDLWLALELDLGAARDSDRSRLVARLVSEASADRGVDAEEVLKNAINAAWPHTGPGLADWIRLLGEPGLLPWRTAVLAWAFDVVCRHPTLNEEIEACSAIVEAVTREAPNIARRHPEVVNAVNLLKYVREAPLSDAWVQRVELLRSSLQPSLERVFDQAFVSALRRDLQSCPSAERFISLALIAQTYMGRHNMHLLPVAPFYARFDKFKSRDRERILELVGHRLGSSLGLHRHAESRRREVWRRTLTAVGVGLVGGLLVVAAGWIVNKTLPAAQAPVSSKKLVTRPVQTEKGERVGQRDRTDKGRRQSAKQENESSTPTPTSLPMDEGYEESPTPPPPHTAVNRTGQKPTRSTSRADQRGPRHLPGTTEGHAAQTGDQQAPYESSAPTPVQPQ